ncbi:MAG: helix-turn-helix transcriptional regulator [Treponema sp.]|nr:helix-turn-helix transcriptional regulator [Treponema sp.]
MNRYIKDNKIVIHPIINQIKTGQNIKNMREEKGMSVRKLADLMEFESVQAVYNWQNGISLPSIINLKILSELFNKSMDDILVFE